MELMRRLESRFSLYGEKTQPTQDMLKEVDVLVYDIQDVGCRFYTYISTLGQCMGSRCAQEDSVHRPRSPQPAGWRSCGRAVTQIVRSFVGAFPIPIRYGLTPGELAGFIKDTQKLDVALAVVKLKNWRRSQWYDETGLVWVPPSPNIPTLEAALVYPGTCFMEGTNLSEGRGTTKPFELIGAPWIDGLKLAESLNRTNLPGVLFRATAFTPTFSKFSGEACQGFNSTSSIARPFVRFSRHWPFSKKSVAPILASSNSQTNTSTGWRAATNYGNLSNRILPSKRSWPPGMPVLRNCRSRSNEVPVVPLGQSCATRQESCSRFSTHTLHPGPLSEPNTGGEAIRSFCDVHPGRRFAYPQLPSGTPTALRVCRCSLLECRHRVLLRCQSGRRALTFGIDFWKDKAQMIQETLSKIEARIRKLSSLRDENKAELLSLLARLKSEIGELSKTHSEEAQSITAFAEVSTHEAARQERNPELLKLSLEGLSASDPSI